LEPSSRALAEASSEIHAPTSPKFSCSTNASPAPNLPTPQFQAQQAAPQRSQEMKIPADGTLAGHATTPFSAVRPQVDDTEEDNNGDAEPEVVHGQSLIEVSDFT